MDLTQFSITTFGDSICEGVVTETDKISKTPYSAVKLLESDYGIKIDNKSSYGQTLFRLCQKGTFDKYLEKMDNTKKNCVVFAIGGNDSDFDWEEVAQSPNKLHSPKTPLPIFTKLLNDTVKKLAKAGVRVVLTTLPPIDPLRYLDNVIAKRVDKTKILTFLKGDVLNIYKNQERYSAEIVRCALKNNCELIDFRSILLIDRNYSKTLCYDGIHPNLQGQKMIAKNIEKIIEHNQIFNKVY